MPPRPAASTPTAPLAASANAWSYGTYVNSGTPTYGFYLSNAWTVNYPYKAYAGYPCSKAAQPGGATLKGYIMASGSYSRCTEY